MKTAKKITVYTAKKIITMNDSQPTATAVAVRDGKILSVGSLADLKPWLDAHPHEIDNTLADKIVMPGFIDPHLHPMLGATALYADIIAAFDWRLPEKTYTAVRGKEAYLARLAEGEAAMTGAPEAPYITWGYHNLFHGDVTRVDLDKISLTRPVFIWTRSTHEMIFNTAALKYFNLTEDETVGNPQINYEEGRYWEAGLLGLAMAKITPFMFNPERYLAGTALNGRIIHFGGLTTVAEMSFGLANPELEWMAPNKLLNSDDTPFRTYFIPDVQTPSAQKGIQKAFEWVESLSETSTHHLRFIKNVKLFADGAFYSQYMQTVTG